MATAPSFTNFKKLSEPFFENGKNYIWVEHPRTKNKRKVRWYTDAEIAKNYGSKVEQNPHYEKWGGLKKARGFEKGPILIIRNVRTTEDEEWLRNSIARYAVDTGWYIISTDELPFDYPKHFKFLALGWLEFKGADEQTAKPATEIAKIISEKERKKEYIVFPD